MIDEIIKAAKSRDLDELERLGCFSYQEHFQNFDRIKVSVFSRDLFREVTAGHQRLAEINKIDDTLSTSVEIDGVRVSIFDRDMEA